jgi:aerobic carbon-monoxide dehydrogenase medium subunit
VKAAPFNYQLADNLPHALALLAEHGGDAKLLAGGQSLVPMMAMRLARPALLVDINRLTELKTIQPSDSRVTMGAGVRQRDVEDARALDAPLPLVQQALRWVGHAQTRNRGTVGGSLVHADPSAELPLAALVLEATMRLQSQADGERTVAAQDFFLGPMFTAVGEAECLTAIDWPVWQGGRVASAFDETAIRHGDFAMASAACQVQLDTDGTVSRASIGVGGVSGAPLAFPVFAAQLVGHRITPALAQELAQAAAKQCDPGSDMHASAEFRRHLAATLLARVLVQAANAAAKNIAG